MSEVAQVPQLRFPEFSGEWEEKILKDLTKINQGLQIPIADRFTEKVENSYFYITNEFLKENSSNKYFIQNPSESVLCTEKDVLMTRTGNTGQVVTNVNGAFHNNFFKIKYSDDLNKDFLVEFLRLRATQNMIFRYAGTSTIPDLNHGDFYRLKLKLPSKPEQQKIATFLIAVDNKIEQLSKKQALLGEYKKGLMQQIFSQAIRFKADDDSEFPDWEERVLGDYLAHKSKKNKNNEVDLVLSVSNKKGFITQDEQFDGYQVASKDLTNYKIVEKGEYAYNPSRINVGSIARLKNNTIGIVSPMYVVFKLKNLDSIFFDNLYQTHLFKHLIKVGCSGSVRDSLNFNDMADFVFSFPSLEEQAKIANFLSSIDSKIEQVGKQLDESKQFKKALLQQMFI